MDPTRPAAARANAVPVNGHGGHIGGTHTHVGDLTYRPRNAINGRLHIARTHQPTRGARAFAGTRADHFRSAETVKDPLKLRKSERTM